MTFVRAHTINIGKYVLPTMTGVRGATMLYNGRFMACCCSFPIYVDMKEVKNSRLAKLVLKLVSLNLGSNLDLRFIEGRSVF